MPKARVIDVVNRDEDANFGAFANHILAEGDSWFAWSHLNARPSSNLLKEMDFERKTVIFNYALSGDVIRNMGDRSEERRVGKECA